MLLWQWYWYYALKDIKYFCLKDGLVTDIYAIGEYIKLINEYDNNLVKIQWKLQVQK